MKFDELLLESGERVSRGVFYYLNTKVKLEDIMKGPIDWTCEDVAKSFTINSEVVDFRGSEKISASHLIKLPPNLPKVTGSFNCFNNELTSLSGSPQKCTGYVSVAKNKLKSYVGGPTEIDGMLDCSSNKLSDFKGFPEIIGNNLEADRNLFRSLSGIHNHIKEIHGELMLEKNPIKSHVLGLMNIKGLKKVYLDNNEVATIINKHLKMGSDIFDCQDELIGAGFSEFAKL